MKFLVHGILFISIAAACYAHVPTLIGQSVQFESKNYPGRFIRHRGFQLWLDQYKRTSLFNLDSNFDIVPGLAGVGISFRSRNYPNRYIRHRGFQCFLDSYTNTGLYKDDASWRVHGGLASSGCVSFESVNYPGRYIRHSGFRVRVDPKIKTALFREDATWCHVPWHCSNWFPVNIQPSATGTRCINQCDNRSPRCVTDLYYDQQLQKMHKSYKHASFYLQQAANQILQ